MNFKEGSVIRGTSYKIIKKVGFGTFALSVFKAVDIRTNQIVAVKVVKVENDFDPRKGGVFGEISTIKKLAGVENVLNLIDSIYFKEHKTLLLVLEYMSCDLAGILSLPSLRFSLANKKCLMLQLLSGLNGIHSRGIMHRDIKVANILVSDRGVLKIGDLGSATNYRERNRFTSQVCTLWYRPPELLLGKREYGPEIDIWATACVFVELISKRNFLRAKNEHDQFKKILQVFGTSFMKRSRHHQSLPLYKRLLETSPDYENQSSIYFDKFMPPLGVDLLNGMFCLDPKKRLTAAQCLDHPFFSSDPLPSYNYNLPNLGEIHFNEAIEAQERSKISNQEFSKKRKSDQYAESSHNKKRRVNDFEQTNIELLSTFGLDVTSSNCNDSKKTNQNTTNDRKTTSPNRKISPNRKTISPNRKTISPNRKTISPNRKTVSPVRSNISPDRKSNDSFTPFQDPPSQETEKVKTDKAKVDALSRIFLQASKKKEESQKPKTQKKKQPSKPKQQPTHSKPQPTHLKPIVRKQKKQPHKSTAGNFKIKLKVDKKREEQPTEPIIKPVKKLTLKIKYNGVVKSSLSFTQQQKRKQEQEQQQPLPKIKIPIGVWRREVRKAKRSSQGKINRPRAKNINNSFSLDDDDDYLVNTTSFTSSTSRNTVYLCGV